MSLHVHLRTDAVCVSVEVVALRTQPFRSAVAIHCPHFAGPFLGPKEQGRAVVALGRTWRRFYRAPVPKGTLDFVFELLRYFKSRIFAPAAHGAHHRPAAQSRRMLIQNLDEIPQVREARSATSASEARQAFAGSVRFDGFEFSFVLHVHIVTDVTQAAEGFPSAAVVPQTGRVQADCRLTAFEPRASG
jgi:hypothetical protein